ncbi:protein rep [Capnocytophaga canimorsus]|uniref:protein rep n=1 Tax=Capnocytophaga canimorsus TaxID=28188 RepID=UPI0037CCFC8E
MSRLDNFLALGFDFFLTKKGKESGILNDNLSKKDYLKTALCVPLDISKKFVRTQSQEFSVLMDNMRTYSGRVIASDKDYERGYTSTCLCGRKRVDSDLSDSSVPVVRGKESQKVYYSGLMKCGSVWRCPVCSFKITQRRQLEVFEIADKWLDVPERTGKKGCLSFITLTLRHSKSDLLEVLLKRLSDEFRKFQRTSVYKRLEKENDIRGFVKTLEIKYSFENGWHPHLHLLYFHTNDKPFDFHNEFIDAWCERKKISALKKAQCAKKVSSKKLIVEYITKWDMSKEMTQGHHKVKPDENKRFTPFLMLRFLTENNFKNTEADRNLKRNLEGLFYEYSRYTKGKHLINISKSLKREMELSDQLSTIQIKSDSEILEDEKIDKVEFKISSNLFNKIVFKGATSLLLVAYENEGLNGVIDLLNLLKVNDKKNHQLLYCKRRKLLYQKLLL